MAVYIPIVSEFNSKGIDKAVKEFKSLETVGQKAQFAIKKAALPAAAALAAVGAALFDATKGAIDDAAAQDLLALTLKKATGATDAQIKANEDWITTQGKLLGISDDELRPALSRLAKATGSVTDAQKMATQAMDIAASTGKPLATVTAALEKAYGGNLAALAKLAPEYRQMIKDGASYEEVMAAIAVTTGGAATTAANSAQGQFKRLNVSLSEAKESIGAALLPAVQKLLPFLQSFGQWAQDHTTTFLVIAGAIAGIAVAVTAANAAMTAWKAITVITTALNSALATSFTAIQVASGLIVFTAIIAGLILAYNKFEWFRDGVKSVFSFIGTAITSSVDFIKGYFSTVLGFYKAMFNGIATIWNSTFGKLKFSIPSWVPGLGGKGFDVPDIPMLAQGGIVSSPTLAMIGEAGPEAVIPLDKIGTMGTNVTIHVNGGDPNAVVAALRTYMRQNGSIPIKINNAY
jgi:hypothetical protein